MFVLVVVAMAGVVQADEFASVEDLLSGNRAGEGGDAKLEELSEEQREEARHHFVSGQEKFKAGEFREAVDHFDRAYELIGAPELLYNIGRCFEELEDSERAVENYEMYLRLSPDAPDAVEVGERIELLSDEPDDVEEEEKVKGGGELPTGVRLQVDLGLGVPISGEWDSKAIPMDLQLHFPTLDWLYIGAGLTLGGFVGDDSSLNGFPRGEFGLYVGAIGAWNLSDRLTLMARLGFSPTWIFRTDQQERAIWLNFTAGVGLGIHLVGPWALTAEVIGGFGPVFVPGARTADMWKNNGIAPSSDIGGRLGFLYTF